jgi:hypothetical protein
MLSRTVGARATRDIDLLAKQDDLDRALEKLKELAETDMGDFVTFEFAGSRSIKVEDEYRDGLSVRFVPIIGSKRMQRISIDLVADEVPLERAELVAPADRIEIEGLQVCDYLVYPVENALADKLCALVERHGGRASSRVKDLVDIAVYATTCPVDGGELQKCVHREAAVRRIALAGVLRRARRLGRIQRQAVREAVRKNGAPGVAENDRRGSRPRGPSARPRN